MQHIIGEMDTSSGEFLALFVIIEMHFSARFVEFNYFVADFRTLLPIIEYQSLGEGNQNCFAKFNYSTIQINDRKEMKRPPSTNKAATTP